MSPTMTAGCSMALRLCGGLPVRDGVLENCKNHGHSSSGGAAVIIHSSCIWQDKYTDHTHTRYVGAVSELSVSQKSIHWGSESQRGRCEPGDGGGGLGAGAAREIWEEPANRESGTTSNVLKRESLRFMTATAGFTPDRLSVTVAVAALSRQLMGVITARTACVFEILGAFHLTSAVFTMIQSHESGRKLPKHHGIQRYYPASKFEPA